MKYRWMVSAVMNRNKRNEANKNSRTTTLRQN